MANQILRESLQDLQDDFEELFFLFSSSLKQLKTFEIDLSKQKKHILSYKEISEQTKQYKNRYEKIVREIKEILRSAQNDSDENIQMLKSPKGTVHFIAEQVQHDMQQIAKYRDLYRSLQSITAGLITSTDWQSPTFNYSLTSLAGRQTGNIIPNYDDYKRDQHSDAKIYAEKFRSEYINSFFKFTIPTYMTNSGMAALTTILTFLQMEKKITGPILLGSSSYFQNKELIKKIFPDVTEIHEHETEKIGNFIKNKKPSLIFFDSLCNSYDMAIPNLKKIIKILKSPKGTGHFEAERVQDDPSASSGQAKKDIYIIIDNTCLAASFQPLQLLGKFPKNIHMIVFESMNKYYQFGMDRTTAGVIYTYGWDMNALFFARQHSGTIISDFACYLLPISNKKLLKKRLHRHERNAKILIDQLQTVVHPTLKSHPAYAWTKDFSFHGSFFTFSFNQRNATIQTYKKFISNVLKEAKKQKVHIVQGTSFGMNTSRIYLTASNTKFGKPFVRFSVGTETRYEIEKIKDVLVKAMENLK